MKIGALAEATGMPVETVRFDVREGLRRPPARADRPATPKRRHLPGAH